MCFVSINTESWFLLDLTEMLFGYFLGLGCGNLLPINLCALVSSCGASANPPPVSPSISGILFKCSISYSIINWDYMGAHLGMLGVGGGGDLHNSRPPF